MVSLFVTVAMLLARPTLGEHSVSLKAKYEAAGLPIYSQNGPLCWAYTINSIVEFEAAQAQNPTTRFSVGYLEWSSRMTDKEGSEGSNFGRAYRALNRYGAAPLALGGDPSPAGVGAEAKPDVQKAALQNRCFDVDWIRFWDTSKQVTRTEFQSVKDHIAAGHPVAIGMRWPNKLTFAPNSFVMNVPADTEVFDGHCVALIGFQDDNNLPGGGAFLFRNSWGANWADHGYAWMPYAYFKKFANDLVAIRHVPAAQPVSEKSILLPATRLTTASIGGVTIQDMKPFGSGWTGNKQSFFQAHKPGDWAKFSFAVPSDNEYAVMLNITRAADYGTFQPSLDGHPFAPIDGVGPGVLRTSPILLGKLHLKKGTHKLTLKVIGKSSASSGYNAGLDSIILDPIKG